MLGKENMLLPEYRPARLAADMQPREFACSEAPAEVIRIDQYPWPGARGPLTEVRGGYTALFCYIGFKVYEEKPVIRRRVFQDPVYEDSCVEFFFNPFPDDSSDYINLEINAAGAFLAQIGASRHNRRFLIADEVKDLQIWASRGSGPDAVAAVDRWDIVLKIPFHFFSLLCDRPSAAPLKGRGNFYKCGDRTGRPHYGCWSPAPTLKPDFHQPDFFGYLIFG